LTTRLDHIIAATRRRVAATKAGANFGELEHKAEQHVPRGFRRALQQRAAAGIAVIAELKKASPSRGLIRPNFDVDALARELESGGATALSVLTDEEFFQGSLQNLERASSVTKLPCLRKDFMVEEYQIVEARANCADAILLIVAALPQSALNSLAGRARDHGLDILCEVHDEEELQRAIDAGCDLIGVNSRDLRTFDVNLHIAFRLAERMPKGVLSIAESGIHTGGDIDRLRSVGYQAFLIGESLMKADSPGEALGALLAEASGVSRSISP
jgi:indole-3-glycerol phosphate synthase